MSTTRVANIGNVPAKPISPTSFDPELKGSFLDEGATGGSRVTGLNPEAGLGNKGDSGMARASWYGPGLYGNRTASGIVLRRDTIGVASPNLPLGTMVRFTYNDLTLTVPVIDRGPYVGDRRFDLTEAAAKKLRMIEAGVVDLRYEY